MHATGMSRSPFSKLGSMQPVVPTRRTVCTPDFFSSFKQISALSAPMPVEVVPCSMPW